MLAPHRPDVKLEDFVVSAAFVALFERVEATSVALDYRKADLAKQQAFVIRKAVR